MMFQIMVYAGAVAVALSVAGLCLERLAGLRGLPSRTVWMVTILFSVLFPIAMIVRAHPPAIQVSYSTLGAPETDRPLTSSPTLRSETASIEGKSRWKFTPPSDSQLIAIWGITSTAFVLILLGSYIRLRQRAAGWRRATVLGQEVLVSETAGPALLGVLQPRIVVPRWVLQQPAETQSLILEHEQQHIRAGDPLTIVAGLVVIAAAPWNLPLWWQWHRMRLAIEVDCDRRVVRAGAEPRHYAEVLLKVTQCTGRMPVGALAMSEPVSALERRILNILPETVRFVTARALVALGLTAASIGGAFALEAPSLPARVNQVPSSAQALIPIVAQAPVSPQPAARISSPSQIKSAAPDIGLLPALPTTEKFVSDFDFVMRTVMQKYPEIVNGPDREGYYRIGITLRGDGSISRSGLQWHQEGESAEMNDDIHGLVPGTNPPKMRMLQRGFSMADVGTLKSDVVLLYSVLPTGFGDPRFANREETTKAIVARYCPDASVRKGERAARQCWVVLTQEGRVIRSGVIETSKAGGKNIMQVEKLNPDLRLGQMQARTASFVSGDGFALVVLAWLAPDSKPDSSGE